MPFLVFFGNLILYEHSAFCFSEIAFTGSTLHEIKQSIVFFEHTVGYYRFSLLFLSHVKISYLHNRETWYFVDI